MEGWPARPARAAPSKQPKIPGALTIVLFALADHCCSPPAFASSPVNRKSLVRGWIDAAVDRLHLVKPGRSHLIAILVDSPGDQILMSVARTGTMPNGLEAFGHQEAQHLLVGRCCMTRKGTQHPVLKEYEFCSPGPLEKITLIIFCATTTASSVIRRSHSHRKGFLA